MTITLRPGQEQLLLDILRTGGYESAAEAIGSALETLHSQNEWLSENGSLDDRKIREGIPPLDRGENIPETELATHLAVWKRRSERYVLAPAIPSIDEALQIVAVLTLLKKRV